MLFKRMKSHKQKDKGINEYNIRKEMKSQFAYAIGIVKDYLTCSEYSNSEKLILLDYVMDVIKIDMQSEYIVNLFYQHSVNKLNPEPFPFFYYDENGRKRELISGELQIKTISLKDDYVITCPWNIDRIKDNILNITKNGFKYFSNNHYSYYYSELDLCIVYNGYHSIASGIYNKNGNILAKVISIKPLFQHIKTDGAYFYNVYTDERLYWIEDFRIAVLFEIAKMKYNLES